MLQRFLHKMRPPRRGDAEEAAEKSNFDPKDDFSAFLSPCLLRLRGCIFVAVQVSSSFQVERHVQLAAKLLELREHGWVQRNSVAAIFCIVRCERSPGTRISSTPGRLRIALSESIV